MKKATMVILLILVVGMLAGGCNGNASPETSAQDYYYEINQLVKDRDFFKAEVCDSEIILYDQNGTALDFIPYGGYQKDDPLRYIRKQDACVYFVRGGAVDDETGVLFVNDDSDGMLEGINHIDRVAGSAYYYDTAK